MFSLSDNIQSERRDCILDCSNLKIGIRMNGEEVTTMIDIAGNMYPAGIPEPIVAPSAALGATSADFVGNGWYGYAYVYAAKNRYPYLDAGQAHAGSIAPRGNPSPILTFQVTGGPRRINVTVTGSERLDVDQIIVYRTVAAATQADALLLAQAGQMYALGLVVNALPTVVFGDQVKLSVSAEIIEFDNNFAPTVQQGCYDGTYVWAIGNDPFIKLVNWAANTVNLIDTGTWFDGRNGQLATISGITTGGIDGRGTFLFKRTSDLTAILTIDGTTPEVLSPATGFGYIEIVGPATTLYRSKPRNPLSWGETIIFGTSREALLFARKLPGDRATAIAIVPGGEYLKIDVKDPNRSFRFSLRAAGVSPNFESSKTEISDISVSAHFSQFPASKGNGEKVLWGYDSDTHAIVESDGNSQVIISDNVFNTLRNCQIDTPRQQYTQGFCNERLELNIMFVAWGTDIQATDLAIFQHYPSGKWGTALVGDLLSICQIRDPLTNLIRFLGGKDSGLLVEQQLDTADGNLINSGAIPIFSYGPGIAELRLPLGTFVGVDYQGYWASWFSGFDYKVNYGRIATINYDGSNTILAFDKILSLGVSGSSYDQNAALIDNFENSVTFIVVGGIPIEIDKLLELSNPNINKAATSISITGLDLDASKLYLFDTNLTPERYPNPQNADSEAMESNQGNYKFIKVVVPKHPRITLRLYAIGAPSTYQLRTININI